MRPAPFLPASLLAAALAIFSAAPACAKVTIAIDQSTQHMTVSVDGAVRYSWPVSTGRAGYGTPNGTFRPFRMEVSHFSRVFDNAPMPHSIFFTGAGHAIHGSLDTGHLGSAASHGCVRLSPDHATTLFQLVKAEGMGDTTVVIAGHTPAGASPDVARRRAPVEESAEAPMQVAPRYNERPAPYYAEQGQQPYYARAPSSFPPQPPPYYAQQPYYVQQQPYYGQPVYQYYRPYNPY